MSPPRSDVGPRGRIGVGGRLLLAFVLISFFATLAAVAGLVAFREVGDRLGLVDRRVPAALAALELSRSAERIIAAAPALLIASDRQRRDAINSDLRSEGERLDAYLRELRAATSATDVDVVVGTLSAQLAELDDVAARKLDLADLLASLRRDVFQKNLELRRLLEPWLQILDGQVAASGNALDDGARAQAGSLSTLLELQRRTETAQRQLSDIVDLLSEASTADQIQRLPILEFQLGRAFDDLASTATGLDPRLQPVLADHVAELRAFAEGPGSLTGARLRELTLDREGEVLVAEIGRSSERLISAVDQISRGAKGDVTNAIDDAFAVQGLSSQVLIWLVVLSIASSALVVLGYVRGIVRRLGALSGAMHAMAGGDLATPVEAGDADEIGAMGRTVEVFRRNSIERAQLLIEKGRAAEQLEREVKVRTLELETANTFKSRFIAAASHDLRQPLYALNLFVAQLSKEDGRGERNRLLTRISAAVSSMNDLFDALLDMSKLEAGVLEAKQVRLPISRLLERLEANLAGSAQEKGLRLRMVSSEVWVLSDDILLERILLNLTSNAIRYAERGGVVVGVRRHGAKVRIDVVDTGPGIPRDQQARIFDEFYRRPGAGGGDKVGIGLGLTIVDRLARLLGHSIEVESRVGRGSRFSVTVPLAEPAEDQAGGPSSVLAVDPLPGRVVVVVDDDPMVLESMRGILQTWGCTVIAEHSADAAIAMLTDSPSVPDLIVSDLRLGQGQSGTEAIARLSSLFGHDVPALVITGGTASGWLAEAMASGHPVLKKPVAPMALRAMLHRLLRKSDVVSGLSAGHDISSREPVGDQALRPQ
ncbi:MAG: ATP-binding protein [Pirellulaceae bacterium]